MTDNNSESSSTHAQATVSPETEVAKDSPPARKRPKPGERRLQILQTLAVMLQEPNGDRVTTAALAARLQVSEAALYRHFASKAQMFEGLIEFIEQTLFGLINQITTNEADALKQLRAILLMMIGFSEKNPGMTRVLVGDALVTEDDRLQVRINQLHDRLEASLKQCFRNAIVQTRLPAETDAGIRANLFISFVLGRWLRYAKSGFKRMPSEALEQHVPLLLL
jgi:TetR/AcrR family transcriptional regulator